MAVCERSRRVGLAFCWTSCRRRRRAAFGDLPVCLGGHYMGSVVYVGSSSHVVVGIGMEGGSQLLGSQPYERCESGDINEYIKRGSKVRSQVTIGLDGMGTKTKTAVALPSAD